MATNIKCPACAYVIDVEHILSAETEQKLKAKYEQQLQESMMRISEEKQKLQDEQKAFDDKRKKENEIFQQKLQQATQKLESEIQAQVRQNLAKDFENEINILKQNNAENEEKLKLVRAKELDYLKKEQLLKTKEQELEIMLQRKLVEERSLLSQQIRKEEADRTSIRETEFQLKLKELEKQLEDQRKLAEEMKRKAEQGSMQLQGEVQELALEELLKSAFPFDLITEVGKGSRGADCVHIIRNNFGQECGRIIYESKRTQSFSIDWIEKLKKDMRQSSSDIAVIVTAVMPKDMDCFGLKDGVWICCFDEVKALANVLRDGVIRVYNSAKSHENKGDKINLLYNYLTSSEFSEQWKAIKEGFLSMKISIQKERDAMEKLWKAREKHLEKVLLSTAHIKGSIEGIAGQNTIDIDLFDEGMDDDEKPALTLR